VAAGADAKVASNWILGDIAKKLNEEGITMVAIPISPADLAGLLQLIDKGTISGKIAKKVLPEMWHSHKTAEAVVKEQGLVQITDTGELETIVRQIVAANPQSVADYQAGKKKAIGFLVGQIMKETKGRANPGVVNQLLTKILQA
jgi:aspartyl/glutamyl-tRNA(asn/gln) amidotransferase subunit B